MTNCILCRILAGELPTTKVYEDDLVVAILDITPVNPGHALVFPKKHAEDILFESDETYTRCMFVARNIGAAIIKSGLATAFNIGINTKEDSGRDIAHTHVHVMPRRAGDGHELWHGKPYPSAEEKERIGERIRISLNQ